MKRSTKTATIATMSFFKIHTTVRPLENSMLFTLFVMDMALMVNMFPNLSKTTIRRFFLKYYRMNYISTQRWKWVLEYPVHSRKRNKLTAYWIMMKRTMMEQYRDLSLASIETVALFQDKVL
jgi:hypothetical protein